MYKDFDGDGKFSDGDAIIVTANVEFKPVTEENPYGAEYYYTNEWGVTYTSYEPWTFGNIDVIDPQLGDWLYQQKYSFRTNERESILHERFESESRASEAFAEAGNGERVNGYRMTDGSYYWDADGDGLMDTRTRQESDGTYWQDTGNNWVQIFI